MYPHTKALHVCMNHLSYCALNLTLFYFPAKLVQVITVCFCALSLFARVELIFFSCWEVRNCVFYQNNAHFLINSCSLTEQHCSIVKYVILLKVNIKKQCFNISPIIVHLAITRSPSSLCALHSLLLRCTANRVLDINIGNKMGTINSK